MSHMHTSHVYKDNWKPCIWYTFLCTPLPTCTCRYHVLSYTWTLYIYNERRRGHGYCVCGCCYTLSFLVSVGSEWPKNSHHFPFSKYKCKLGVVARSCNPSTWEVEVEGSGVQVCHDDKKSSGLAWTTGNPISTIKQQNEHVKPHSSAIDALLQ